MYKIFHHNIVKMIFVREPSTILKYKVIQAQRVWNESRYSLVSLRSAVNCKSMKIGGLRRISFEMQGAHAETKRSMPEHVSIGFRGATQQVGGKTSNIPYFKEFDPGSG